MSGWGFFANYEQIQTSGNYLIYNSHPLSVIGGS
jgi:hypothetical protein